MGNETNKSYRIRTNINGGSNVLVNFSQEYETFELLSIKMKTENLYRLHNANYGVVVGRVQANGGFGVPNAKLSIFIEVDQDNENSELLAIYGYTDVFQTNSLGNTYNLLPDEQVSDCHKKIGAFPSKRYLLDNDTYIEVYDKYYKYTTRTNNAGDYIIVGVPVGNQTLHMDLDLSDCGILSQRPRDFVYKGYNIEQFDNPNQFKSETGASINFLSQYVQQTKTVYVNPLWGNNELGETIGITRADVDVNFKFEPTCVFMGSIISDSRSNGISQKCVPTDQMGMMDELTTGKGTIEMIRKTPTNDVEEFQIKGNELIDGNGTWCYQIPMNLDYITTNEYGETVATDNPNIGIPTRARVRFRVSLDNFENSNDNYFAGKVLVPNNPQVIKKDGVDAVDYDYAFGTDTGDDSYRDLFWNNVYSVKQHIPRIQKSGSWRTDRFTGIKQCNFYGQNNPIPYNSIRIKLPFMFIVLCALIKTYVRIVSFLNAIINAFFHILVVLFVIMLGFMAGLVPVFCLLYVIMLPIAAIARAFGKSIDLSKLRSYCTLDASEWGIVKKIKSIGYIAIADGICPDLETWYFAPMLGKLDYCPSRSINVGRVHETYNICSQTVDKIVNDKQSVEDSTSTDASNKDTGIDEKICITKNIDYLMTCIEMNLAQEYKVIKFDFYNDWINGMLYIPRWKFRPEHKITFLFGLIKFKVKTRGCFDDNSLFGRTRWLTQHCSLGYKQSSFTGGYIGYSKIGTQNGCSSNKKRQKCHKGPGIRHTAVFGPNGGIIHQEKTMLGQTVYYYKPSEMSINRGGLQSKINMFATDIILLGSLKDCDENGVPQSFKWLSSSSYKMPTNLALTNLDEAGVLFVDKGSYCKGGTSSDIDNKKVSVAENSFKGQIKWSSTAPVEIQIMGYGEGPNSVENIVNVASDRIALTEAAGISWDYTGPSQAASDNNDLFSPGGHFLGMSCVNSKTNIKSCVNLQRICEAGATMSERVEKTRGLKIDKDGKYKQQAVVFSPNGLISTDEIIAGSFRNMFATMNINPLIATKKDENTGYLVYDFKYLRANGFEGGAQSSIVSKSSNYNRSISGIVKSQEFVYDSGDVVVDDIDESEYDNTYHRSIEATNFGYYRFRFGLRNSEQKVFNAEAPLKYALTQNGLKYLPQYENSFYFYFGLKDGNTALDRFYSDFFSMCPTRQHAKTTNIKVKDSGTDYCTREQSIWVTSEGIVYPYDITLINGSTTIIAKGISYKSVNICGLAPGIWTITVTDSEGLSVNKKVRVGANIKDIEYTLNDFKEELDDFSLEELSSRLINSENKNPKGGELNFNIEDIRVFGKSIKTFINGSEGDSEGGPVASDVGLLLVSSTSSTTESVPTHALMLAYEEVDKSFTHREFDKEKFYNSSVMKEGVENRHKTDFEFNKDLNIKSIHNGAVSINGNDICLYLWGDNMYYTLYFIYNVCGTEQYCALELCRFYSYGYSSFNVYLGSKYLKYNGKNSENYNLSSFLKSKNRFELANYGAIINEINSSGGEKAYKTQWALRQAIFDQRYSITGDSSDRIIRCTNLNGEFVDGFLFGQPERVSQEGDSFYQLFTDSTSDNEVLPLSVNDYQTYVGYEIDDTASLLPSIDNISGEAVKLPYYRMSFDSEYGLILSKPICEITVTGVDDSGDFFVSLAYSTDSLELNNDSWFGKPFVIQSKENKDVIIECVRGTRIGAKNQSLLVPKTSWESKEITIGSVGMKFDVMPTLVVPIIHRPFYFEAYPFMLGQFTAKGKATLSIAINPTGEDEKVKVDGVEYTYKNIHYGDRELTYKLSRDSDVENKIYINDYIRIYGGNACGPNYYLSENCTHFGEPLKEKPKALAQATGGIGLNTGGGLLNSPSRPLVNNNGGLGGNFNKTTTHDQSYLVSISKTITSEDINACVERLCEVATTQPDTIEVTLGTGTPDMESLKEKDSRSYDEIMAFADGDEDNLETITSYTIDDILPKEIVIRKKVVENEDEEGGGNKDIALIEEEGFLDIGDTDVVSVDDVNKYVKLYMVIMPDNGKFDNISKAMNQSMLPPDISKDKNGNDLSTLYGGKYYARVNSKDIFGRISFADYFSNPNAVAFFFDQMIHSAHLCVKGVKPGTMAWDRIYQLQTYNSPHLNGGYFHRPDYENYVDPNLNFPDRMVYTEGFMNRIIDGNKDINYTSGNTVGVWATISGIGSSSYASIEKCLGTFKHSDSKSNSMLGYIKESKLYTGMAKFGFDLSVVTKYYDADEKKYPTSAQSLDIYYLTIADKYGVDVEENSTLAKTAERKNGYVLKSNYFDGIIGRNWSFPNIEYVASTSKNDPDIGVYSGFTKKIIEEYERVKNINKSKGEDDALETPNYAKIIAEFFINSSYNTDLPEDKTLENLYSLAATSKEHESFIVPIILGERRDEDGKIKSSFNWPGDKSRFKVQRDRPWICTKNTARCLNHANNDIMLSDIEDSIYDDNLSYGFRSVIIGIYDGPEEGYNCIKDTEGGTGNSIRPFKIYTFHSKGTSTSANEYSKAYNTHAADDIFCPNDYYNKRKDPSNKGKTKQKKENLGLYYYHNYENDYDQYASGWC